jgi:hypothetical protein
MSEEVDKVRDGKLPDDMMHVHISSIHWLRQRLAQRLRHALDWLTPAVRQRIWRGLMILSIIIASISVWYGWREFSRTDYSLEVGFVALAVAIYGFNFSLQTLAWHMLAKQHLGVSSLRANMLAVAQSNLVKMLPSVVWYIANRTDFYVQRGSPAQRVVAVSLLELILTISSALLLLVVFWLSTTGFQLSAWGLLVVGILVVGALTWRYAQAWWHRKITVHTAAEPAQTRRGGRCSWLIALLLYMVTWLTGVVFLWVLLRAFMPMQWDDLALLSGIWLLSNLASLLMALTLGAIDILREVTLVILLSQYWPISLVVLVAVLVKVLLMLGNIGFSALMWGGLWLIQMWIHDE